MRMNSQKMLKPLCTCQKPLLSVLEWCSTCMANAKNNHFNYPADSPMALWVKNQDIMRNNSKRPIVLTPIKKGSPYEKFLPAGFP